jgi:hypothetical protein
VRRALTALVVIAVTPIVRLLQWWDERTLEDE